jgi:hypothetical protein
MRTAKNNHELKDHLYLELDLSLSLHYYPALSSFYFHSVFLIFNLNHVSSFFSFFLIYFVLMRRDFDTAVKMSLEISYKIGFRVISDNNFILKNVCF